MPPDATDFRVYESGECGADGYPLAWHKIDGGPGVKHLVRERAGHRCVRCGHPYTPGCGTMQEGDDLHARRTERELGVPQAVADIAFESLVADGNVTVDPKGARRTLWSPCDELCTHTGPIRMRLWDKHPNAAHLPWIVHDETSKAPAGGHVERGREVQASWRILTVHHLSGDKADCRWWNLAALCQRCHLTIQGAVVLDRVWPHEHSAWFRPYAAGWYAHHYLGQDLTREQVQERLDELLALELAGEFA